MDRSLIVELLTAGDGGPCLSIYQPTHRRFPEKRQDPVRFRNLIAQAETLLRERWPREPHETLLGPLREIAANEGFWLDATPGLAVFCGGGRMRVMRLARPVPEAVTVDASFHVRPLLRIAAWAGRYQVLCLTRRAIRMLEGDRDGIVEIEPAPGVRRTLDESIAALEGSPPEAGAQTEPAAESGSGHRGRGGTRTGRIHHRHGDRSDAVDPDVEIFFREVDRTVTEFHSRPSGLPLVLVGAPENLGPFRALARNPAIVDHGVESDPSALTDERIRERAWALVDATDEARVAALLERYGGAQAHGLGNDRPDELVGLAREGRIETLLLEAPPLPAEGSSDMPDGRSVPESVTDATLDELAERVLLTGGDIVVVSPGRLAGGRRAAAILRY
ncbi:MAG TPA: hypothetical protein VEA81_00525 [Burkholderiaceae bacterium]|nr:hypothetical protein [Burkholderiaceae bacterium]